jgi:hypothetical protein
VSNVKNIKPILVESQKKHKGKIWVVRFKRQYTANWESISNDSYAPIHFFKTRNGVKDNPEQQFPIEKMFVQMRLHSEQHCMTEDEINQRDKERENEAKTADKVQVPTDSEKMPQNENKRKVSNYSKPSREWKRYDFEFLYRRALLYVSMFNDAYLSEGVIYGKKGETILETRDLGDVIRWVAKEGKLKKGKPIRSSAVVMENGKAVLEEIYDNEMKKLFTQGYDDELRHIEVESKYSEVPF